jgi:hypothetical protein
VGKGTSIVCSRGTRLEFSSREGYAFIVGDDPHFSGVDESSESATSFPESATSFEDVVIRVDETEGHISVMIPYPTYRRILAYLAAIQSPLEPEELIASILEGWAGRLNL